VIGEAVRHYQGKSTDPDQLAQQVEEYLSGEGFTTQRSPASSHGIVIQARKGHFLEEIIAADRALTIVISGEADDLLVRVGIGKWVDHLATAVFETLLLSGLFLVVDVAEMAWSLEIENKLLKKIDELVG
jgi:hypothetical protein